MYLPVRKRLLFIAECFAPPEGHGLTEPSTVVAYYLAYAVSNLFHCWLLSQ